jgi:hypothetical protein
MATSDLTNELLSPTADPVLNDTVSHKIVDAVLGTLQDKNGEVQNMGVKWSYPLRRLSDFLVCRRWCLN